jgi:hypothetical protein
MMIDSDRLRYYIHRELFMSTLESDAKFSIFNLKESLDEQDNRH